MLDNKSTQPNELLDELTNAQGADELDEVSLDLSGLAPDPIEELADVPALSDETDGALDLSSLSVAQDAEPEVADSLDPIALYDDTLSLMKMNIIQKILMMKKVQKLILMIKK